MLLLVLWLSTSSAAAPDGKTTTSGRPAVVSPSLLAADVGHLAAAAEELVRSGAHWVHVDVTDGSAECGRSLSSLGPASIAAVRRAAPSLCVDVHLYVREPEHHVEACASAGADRITFQIETMAESGASTAEVLGAAAQERAAALATVIGSLGCSAGVCLAPTTPIEAVSRLVSGGLVDLVNVLSVHPGIGGQPFQADALARLRALRKAHPQLPFLMVDGGIDAATAPLAAAAGANALVAGSYIFRAPMSGEGSLAERLRVLERALAEEGD